MCRQESVRGWVASSSLHVLEYLAVRQFKREGVDPAQARQTVRQLLSKLLDDLNPLSCFGFQQDQTLVAQTDLEDAQIVAAASHHSASYRERCCVAAAQPSPARAKLPALNPNRVGDLATIIGTMRGCLLKQRLCVRDSLQDYQSLETCCRKGRQWRWRRTGQQGNGFAAGAFPAGVSYGLDHLLDDDGLPKDS